MKRSILIGILAITALVIAGCTTQVRESPTKNLYGQGLTDCTVISTSGTGIPSCADIGYVCVAEEGEETVKYLTSTDGTCGGDKQLDLSFETWVECQNLGGGGGAGCTNNEEGVEPYFGDVSHSSSVPAPGEHKVICCK